MHFDLNEQSQNGCERLYLNKNTYYETITSRLDQCSWMASAVIGSNRNSTRATFFSQKHKHFWNARKSGSRVTTEVVCYLVFDCNIWNDFEFSSTWCIWFGVFLSYWLHLSPDSFVTNNRSLFTKCIKWKWNEISSGFCQNDDLHIYRTEGTRKTKWRKSVERQAVHRGVTVIEWENPIYTIIKFVFCCWFWTGEDSSSRKKNSSSKVHIHAHTRLNTRSNNGTYSHHLGRFTTVRQERIEEHEFTDSRTHFFLSLSLGNVERRKKSKITVENEQKTKSMQAHTEYV